MLRILHSGFRASNFTHSPHSRSLPLIPSSKRVYSITSGQGYTVDGNNSEFIANSGSETESIMKKYIQDQQKVDEMMNRAGMIVEKSIKASALQSLEYIPNELMEERLSGWLNTVLHPPSSIPKEYDPQILDPKFVQEKYLQLPKSKE